jgi:serine/threonine protein kinase/TolB-like protein
VIGQRVGPYAVLQRLGGGGMGEVYLAEDTRLGRQVALKRPSEAYLSMPDARGRLHREASAAGRLTHPNIAAIYDVLDVDAQPYIVMEYVEGESLVNVLRRGPLPMDRAITVASEIVEALSAAHAKGIVHRDLKPANIALTPDGHAKVLDFGLAKGPPLKEAAAQPVSTITVPGQVMGTPGYSSPEQLVGAPADPRDDIYSLGVVLFELLTGRRPFDGNDSLELAMATMTKTAPPVHQVNPTLPETLSPIVARAMARDRDDRYQSAEELRTALRRYLHVLTTDVTHLIDSGALKVAHHRRRRYLLAAIAAGVLIAAAALGVWWKSRPVAPALSRPPVLGIQAFVNNSVESDAPLAAGMRDMLITELASTPGLVLLSRSAIDESARQHADPRQLSRDLDATHLLETTVRRSGQALTLSVTLSRGDSGVFVWNGSV